jgi:hypothetical protein
VETVNAVEARTIKNPNAVVNSEIARLAQCPTWLSLHHLDHCSLGSMFLDFYCVDASGSDIHSVRLHIDRLFSGRCSHLITLAARVNVSNQRGALDFGIRMT